ncbi:replication restart helicase PriA [Arcticibacter tournemirensis]|uniref:Replication restart protein PriA n=1 Tax=Arcticibacter tournemirensis TaxID=699437 RepID=A0A4Q0M724_9SPHI|nr:primosomal protein N' [Arcticibacter tournemirensis]RXF68888.1 primosomal protein N' [Arcticibacter tournemirensis]
MLELNEEKGELKTFFVDVILPLAISKTYTYRVPQSLNEQVAVGKRVVVQFGKSRIYTAIIYHISENPPKLYDAKYVIDVLDESPVVNQHQLKLWEWISAYYMCHLGEVMQAALPSALKLASETRVVLLKDAVYDKKDFNDKEFLIIDALEIQPELKVSDIVKLLGQKSVFRLLKSLFDKGVIHISEEVIERYKPKQVAYITLHSFYTDADNRKALFDVLERSPKQLDILLAYLKLSRSSPYVAKKEILEESGSGNGPLKALIDKEIFVVENRVVSRLKEGDYEHLKEFTLSEEQEQTLGNIKALFEEKDVVLLHGITSSGKTQVYIRLIEECIESGRQVLYLLPEIALTTQIIERLREYFGSKIGIYHSRLGDNERAEVWTKVLNNEYNVVLGARSAVFLPFTGLGLIVVDEEHESSYKQYDPAPRYHARDTAIYAGRLHEAKVLLGSATPSLESYFNSKTGKYGFAELRQRYGESNLPAIKVVSIAEETSKKTIQSHFTSVLIDGIKEALEKKEQVILFQNRRGYTPLLICKTCGYIPQCIHCDVSLTYHKSTGKLHCHYCGYKQDTVPVCPACGSTHIEQKGFGTEKIEDDLQFIFPEARIARMDLDTTRSKNSFQRILNDFEERRIDVLVGTQIVAKGLDFDHVTLIGIINADSLLNYPDFRAFERSFQLLSQVGGRAGRRGKPGTVIIQAYSTNHRVIQQVIEHDYEDLFRVEIAERKSFRYPPLYRMIRIDVKHKDSHALSAVANRLGQELKKALGERVLGPEDPLVGRIRNFFIKTLYIKVERDGIAISKVKEFLRGLLLNFEADKHNKGTLIQVDVDPY